jgi:hypothetical protein
MPERFGRTTYPSAHTLGGAAVMLHHCSLFASHARTTTAPPLLWLFGCPRRRHHRFDERFTGYGKNKIQWLHHLRLLNYSFLVLPELFAVRSGGAVGGAGSGGGGGGGGGVVAVAVILVVVAVVVAQCCRWSLPDLHTGMPQPSALAVAVGRGCCLPTCMHVSCRALLPPRVTQPSELTS